MCDLAFKDSRNPGFLKKRLHEKYKKYLTEDGKMFLEEESEIKNAIVDIGLRDNDLLKIEGLSFRVIHTPGHTEDSICLYNAHKGWLFTGDSVQGGGTFPPRSLVQDIGQYLTSINKLKYLKINKLMAGHAFIPFNPRSDLPVFDEKKAEKLIEFSISHTERTREEIMNYILGKTVSALEVSKVISNFIFGSQNQAKIFRNSAIAYLKNLENTGWVKTTEKKGKIYFTQN
jgi:glyoxylase-like metal-dependent hydrolase (beta-lactamase superfamily II)